MAGRALIGEPGQAAARRRSGPVRDVPDAPARRRRLVGLAALGAVGSLALGLGGCASSGGRDGAAPEARARFGVVTVTEADAGRPIHARVGEQIEFRIASTPGRGAAIRLGSVVQPVLVQDGPVRYVDDTEHQRRDGATNFEIWRFRASAAGQTAVRFEFRRAWETTGPAARVLAFDVTVS